MEILFRRDYLVRLPLPLAQLYSRAYNAKYPRSRHDNAFYLCEALVKLTAAPLAACYLEEAGQGQPRLPALDQLLAQLALPSLGQWLAMLRELARYFGSRPDAGSHPLGHLWQQLNKPRRDLPALLAVYRRIKNGADGQVAGDQNCSVMQVLEALVQYRNAVFGHGGPRFESFFEQEMGPLLFPAVNELLEEGTLEMLGPKGSRLAYVNEIRQVEQDRFEVSLRELVGLQGERLAALNLTPAQAQALVPNRVCVLWPGRAVPLRLDPLLVYRESETAEEVLFLNRDHNGRQVEYLSYTTGRTERDKSMSPALAGFLSQVCGRKVTETDLRLLAEQSMAETPSMEMLLRPTAPAGRVVGDYEMLVELGRGGMGVVYLARQLSLGRLVALKMLPGDLAGDEVALARFRREIKHLAECEHPNIVKVLADGVFPDGRLYYTMEYIPGSDLEAVWNELASASEKQTAQRFGQTTWSKAVLTASRKKRDQIVNKPAAPTAAETMRSGGGPVTVQAPLLAVLNQLRLPEPPSLTDEAGGYVRRVVQMVRDAALALESMHQKNVVHRDVKPANLMLTADGARVVLMDFGLAKGDSHALAASKDAGFLGTLRYAAPEQLAAAMVKVGPGADVRALGCVLWELLTRKRLFGEAEDEARLAAKVLNEEVPRLRRVDPSLDRDLEAIVARATEKDAGQRIQNAGQLAEYLRLYLEGKPIPIRPPGVRELAWRWVKRHKELAASMCLVFLLLIGGGVAANWYRQEQAQRKVEATQKLARIEQDIRNAIEQGNTATAELRSALKAPAGVQKLLNEPGRWGVMFQAASSAAAQARALQKNADGNIDPKLVDQMAVLDADINAEKFDWTFATELEDLRLERINLVTLTGKSDTKKAEENFQKKLGGRVFKVEEKKMQQVADVWRKSSIKEQVLAALDDWAMLALRGGNKEQVEKLLQFGRAIDPDPVRDELRDPKMWEDKKQLLARLMKVQPAELPPHLSYLMGYLLKHYNADAETWLRAAQQKHPADFWLNVQLGVVLGDKKPADAAGFFRAAIAIRPASGRLYNNLGIVLGLQKDGTGAIHAFKTAIALNPADVTAYYNLGNMLGTKGDYKEAIAAYKGAIGLGGKFGFLYQNLGEVLFQSDDFSGAEEAYLKAAELEPSSPEPFLSLGKLLHARKKFEEAIWYYDKAIKVDPKSAVAFNNWGRALFDTKDVKGAISKYEKAIECNPKFALTHANLGLALVALGDFKGATQQYQQACQLEPKNAQFCYRLGTALSAQKKFPAAIVAFTKATQLDDKYAGAYQGLGESLLEMGYAAEAKQAVQKALELSPDKSTSRPVLEKLLKECDIKLNGT